MAEYTVQHSCGHEVKHRYDGPETERRQREQWLRSKPCQICHHAEQIDTAAKQRDELNLPQLVGEEADIRWAEVVRAKAITHNRKFYARVTRKPDVASQEVLHEAIVQAADDAMRELSSQTAASWWIDHRFDVIEHVRKATIAAVEPLMNGGE